MPTLLQINSVVNSGSTGHIAEQVGLLAQQAGWKSYIAFGRMARQSQSKLIKIGNIISIYEHAIESHLFDNHGLASTFATNNLINQIKCIRPDIIHLHNIHGYYINYRILFKYLSKINIPIIWTLHDCWPYTGHCSHYADIGCVKWQKQCSCCPKIHNYPKSLFIDNSKRNFKIKNICFNSLSNLTLVPVSHWLEDEVKKSFLAKHKIQCILNGIDIDQFCPKSNLENIRTKYGLSGKIVLLGVATTWGPRKGWNDYIRLSQILSEDYKIIMVGVTNKQSRNLPKSILTIPRTENINQLVELYNIADVVLNLSDEESFGLTTVEGFACGTPGIVYNCTASPELITEETGMIVEKGNIKSILENIELIKYRGKEYYKDNCRKRAETYYNKDTNYKQYIELYNKIYYL